MKIFAGTIFLSYFFVELLLSVVPMITLHRVASPYSSVRDERPVQHRYFRNAISALGPLYRGQKIKIAIVGGSFTFPRSYYPEKDWLTLLSDELPEAHIDNFSVRGASQPEITMILEKIGQTWLKYDLVLISNNGGMVSGEAQYDHIFLGTSRSYSGDFFPGRAFAFIFKKLWIGIGDYFKGWQDFLIQSAYGWEKLEKKIESERANKQWLKHFSCFTDQMEECGDQFQFSMKSDDDYEVFLGCQEQVLNSCNMTMIEHAELENIEETYRKHLDHSFDQIKQSAMRVADRVAFLSTPIACSDESDRRCNAAYVKARMHDYDSEGAIVYGPRLNRHIHRTYVEMFDRYLNEKNEIHLNPDPYMEELSREHPFLFIKNTALSDEGAIPMAKWLAKEIRTKFPDLFSTP